MKRIIIILCAMLGMAAAAGARPAVDGVSVNDVTLEHNGRLMTVGMTLDLTGLDVSSNRAVLLTPRLVNKTDTLVLPSVGIYGRRRYYFYVRNGRSMLTDKNETSYRASQCPDRVVYEESVPYEEWMNGSQLTLHRSDWGCCNTLLAEQAGALGDFAEAVEFFPVLVYVQPQAEAVKSRSLQGSAYIDFPVNETVIYPDYRRNTTELGKIRATIDSVRNDRDVTITSVWLKGYASPEGSYASNRELAIGRTQSLRTHIQQLYNFEENIIATDYEPEDWAGLRRYVEQSNIDSRAAILDLIDSDMEPDAKEWKIKRSYPEDYSFLLHNCYPALRHTDYRIAYTIRGFSDADEIRRVMLSQPQKLSLNEFYVLSGRYEPGTDEFTEIFETAVRMYPADETANLNAANAAMRRGDNEAAARYIAKAGNSPEAVYARGALAIRTGDYAAARRILGEAKALGVRQAALTLDELDEKGI